jgi:cell wall-associated NlpC family hydrolase
MMSTGPRHDPAQRALPEDDVTPPRRVVIGCAVVLVLVLLCCCGGVTALYFETHKGSTVTSTNAACTVNGTIAVADLPDLSPLTKTEETNASTIVTVGQSMDVPPRGWIIAVATAMQESHLQNLPNLGASNDHDSLGLFQQRPSQGWGTPAQILDPTYASTTFYTRLLAVKGWQGLPLTDAAQAVQRSAYPDAYAKWEPDATQLVGALVADSGSSVASNDEACSVDGGDLRLDNGAVSLPAGFSLPVGTPTQIVTAINWALAQIGTPYSFGGSCADAHSGRRALECDCSSLTMMSYRASGVTIPRLAAEQSRVGTPIYDLHTLMPGDLLFLVGSDGTREDPGHVGMYLGQGVIINAPHTGAVVRLTTLADWSNGIVDARRVIESKAVGSQ